MFMSIILLDILGHFGYLVRQLAAKHLCFGVLARFRNFASGPAFETEDEAVKYIGKLFLDHVDGFIRAISGYLPHAQIVRSSSAPFSLR